MKTTKNVLDAMHTAHMDLVRRRRERAAADAMVTKAETTRTKACEAEASAEKAYASARAAVQQSYPDAART